MTYIYKINDYTELRIASRESGGVELTIVNGHRAEWIGVKPADVDEVVRQIREHAVRDHAGEVAATPPSGSGDPDGESARARGYHERGSR
jgi:hypothetical protein